MKLLERILVATDFGDGSDDAVRTAVCVAKTYRPDVLLLHDVPSSRTSADAREMTGQRTAQQLQAIADRFKADGIAMVETMFSSGVTRDVISECANQHDANVIVIG